MIVDINLEKAYPVKQIWPAHADHISGYKTWWLNEMFNNEACVAQRKYDGERMLVHFNGNNTYCTSRRISKKTNRYMENQDRLVNLPVLKGLKYTVIDCECYSKNWSAIAGILHSLPERAAELQKETPVWFAVFDCLWYDGQDLTGLPYSERLRYVYYLLANKIKDKRFHFVEQTYISSYEDAKIVAENEWSKGNEGIVIKSMDKAYYDKGAMLKLKRIETVDVVVYDYQQGNGKYSKTVGALLVGYYDPEKNDIVHLSKVNCGTDEDRASWKSLFDKDAAKGLVIEVKCQEITEKSLRHPVYIRLRLDKDYKMCTRETIFKE